MIHHPAGLSPFRAILEKLLILHFKLLGFFTIFAPTSPPLYKSITMPSSLSQRVSRAFSISSRSQKRSSVQSVQSLQSDQSYCTDGESLLDPAFPSPYCPPRLQVMMEESDVLDPEDQAWGSPPSNFNLPRFLRRKT